MRRLGFGKALLTGAVCFSMMLAGCGWRSGDRPHAGQSALPAVAAADDYVFSYDDAALKRLDGAWWQSFDRPALNGLIAQALAQNPDIDAALARLAQAEAVTRRTRADFGPDIDLGAAYNKNWRGGDPQRASGDIGADLAWELDLFGRIAAAARRDALTAEARMAGVDAARLAVSLAVAESYFRAVAAQERLELLQSQADLDRDLLKLLTLRQDEGVGTNVEVLQQRARLADSETLIPLAEADRAVQENRIAVLLGQMPDGVVRVPYDENLAFVPAMPPLGVPAALLLQRPDLRAAQAELAAADAGIAAAIAERLPRVTLDGSYAFTDGAAYTGPLALITGMFVQPLLDWGARKAEVARNKALYRESLADFTGAYLRAVEDVENALVQAQKQRAFLERLDARRKVLAETVETTEQRYRQGIDDYLPVIDALQELRQVERDLIAEQLTLVQFRIDLFRALGGPMTEVLQENSNESDT